MRSFGLTLLAVVACLATVASAEVPIPFNYNIASLDPALQNEEQIWTCPTDSAVRIAVWRDFRLGYRQVGIGRSWFHNDIWQDSLINPAMQVFERQSDPTLTVDKNGNFYISVLDYQDVATAINDSSYISFLVSTDKGESWSGPYTVEDSLGPYFEDKQFITADRTDGPYSGNVYVAWARFPNPNRIMFARSTDGAMTFDDTLIVGPNQDGTPCGFGILDAGQFACPAVGSDGAVYVMWIGGDLDTVTCDYFTSMKMVKSTDGGASFTEPRVIRYTAGNWWQVDGGVDVYNQPSVAADLSGGPYDGNIYIAYGSVYLGNPEYYDYNIEFIKSTDGGATWSNVIYINDDYIGPGATFDQFHPWLICNDDGTLVAIWYDQRTDPVNHYKFDAFAAYSFDGGATFTGNHRISNVSVDPDLLKKSGAQKPTSSDPRLELPVSRSPRAGLIGEYIGITAYQDVINAVWTDTRYGNSDVFGAHWEIPLVAPRLLSPEDGGSTSDLTPTFLWSTAWHEDDDEYELQIAYYPDFANSTFYVCLSEEPQCTYNNTGFPLEYDSTYYWRVKVTKISTGEFSDWSEPRSFTVTGSACFATGDVNNDGGVLSQADMIYLRNYVDGSGPVPPVPYSADLNGDCQIDYLDVKKYEDYFLYGLGVFESGYPVPTCCDVDTVRGACCVTDTCYELSLGNCLAMTGGNYSGDGVFCSTDPCSCCRGIRGNVDGDAEDNIDISDLVYLVDFMFNDGPEPSCLEEADVDGGGGSTPVDIADLVYLVDYMFNSGPLPVDCP